MKIKENNWLLTAIVIGSFFNSFMSSSLNIAMPVIDAEYHVGLAEVAWISKSFLLASAVELLFAGWLADQFGRRKIFLIGNIIFGVFSLAIILAENFYIEVALRFIQGLGSSMIMASSPALIASAFPSSRRGFTLGIQTTFTYMGLSLAPLLGGLMTQTLGWKSLFMLNFIFTVLVIIIMLFNIHHEWKNEEISSFDLRGYLLFVVSMISIVFALEWINWKSIVALCIAGIVGYFFVSYELRIEQPFISIPLLKNNKYFTHSVLAALINYATTFAISYVLSLYLQKIRGISPFKSGLILCFQPLMMALFSAYSGHLSDRHNPGKIASYGMMIIAVSLFFIGLLLSKTLPLYVLAIVLAVLGFGFALFSSPNTNAVMSSVEANSYGFASAFLAFNRLFGQFISLALSATLISLFNRQNVSPVPQHSLLIACKIIFIIFAILSCCGVYLSSQRIHSKVNSK